MVDVDDAKHTTTVYLCKKFNKIVVVKEKKKKKKHFCPVAVMNVDIKSHRQ